MIQSNNKGGKNEVKKIKNIVRKAQRGNLEAFLELFETYKDQLYRTAFFYTRHKEDALDVIQETAYRAFKNIHTLKHAKYVKTWMIRIIINCSIDLLESKKKIIPIESEFLESMAYENEDLPLSITLEQLMDVLHEKEKSVIILKCYHGYIFKEIAEMLGLPLGTVKSYYYRSLKKLKNHAERTDYYE